MCQKCIDLRVAYALVVRRHGRLVEAGMLGDAEQMERAVTDAKAASNEHETDAHQGQDLS